MANYVTLTTTSTANAAYRMQMQQVQRMTYPLTDRKIVYNECAGTPARKATNADWLDKRIADIRIKL